MQRGEFPPPRQLDPSIDRGARGGLPEGDGARSPRTATPSPRLLADDIERWMADEPVTAWREPLLTRSRRWVRKHQTLATTTTALVVFGLAGMALAYSRRRATPPSSPEPTPSCKQPTANPNSGCGRHSMPSRITTTTSAKASFVNAAIWLTSDANFLTSPRPSTNALPRNTPTHVTRTLATAFSWRGRRNLGRILNMLGEDKSALEHLQSAVTLFQQLAARDPDNADLLHDLASGYIDLGQTLLRLAECPTRRMRFRKSIAACGGLVARHADVADYRYRQAIASNSLSNVLIRLGRWDDAEPAIRNAIAAFDLLVTRQPKSVDTAPVWQPPTRPSELCGVTAASTLKRSAPEGSGLRVRDDLRAGARRFRLPESTGQRLRQPRYFARNHGSHGRV